LDSGPEADFALGQAQELVLGLEVRALLTAWEAALGR
jgi:hypothetical protein